MSEDEQTKLLKQILDVQREHLALTKQYRLEAMVAQEKALSGQGKSLRMSRVALLFLGFAVCVLAALVISGANSERQHAKPDAGMAPRD